MLYLLSALSVMYILLMYYISLLLLPPDGFVLCYIGLLVLTLWRFDDNVIGPSPGKGRLQLVSELPGSHTCSLGLDTWFTPHAAQVSMPSVVIREYTEYVADRIRISFAMRDREPPRSIREGN